MATDRRLQLVPCAGPGECQHPSCSTTRAELGDQAPRRAFYECPVTGRPCQHQDPQLLAELDDQAPEVVLIRCPNYGSDHPDAAYGPMPRRHAEWIVDQFTDPASSLGWTILPLSDGPPGA